MIPWLLGVVFVVIPIVGNSAIRATGDTKTPSMIMVIAAVVNAVLDPLLIFGYGPFPALGIKGAAIANSLSYLSSSLFLMIMFIRATGISLSLFIPNKTDLNLLKNTFNTYLTKKDPA